VTWISIIRPSITFASIVQWPGCQTASAKKTLSRIQRLACLGIMGEICITATGVMEVLNGLPPLDLVIQGEAGTAAHRLWSLGCLSYLHPSRGHSSVLMQLQQSDPTFKMGVDVMRPEFNFKPKYRVAMLPTEEWTRGTGTPPAVKGFIWFTDGSRMKNNRAGVYGQSVGRRLSTSLGSYATVFQAAICAILACAYEIQLYGRPEKYVL